MLYALINGTFFHESVQHMCGQTWIKASVALDYTVRLTGSPSEALRRVVSRPGRTLFSDVWCLSCNRKRRMEVMQLQISWKTLPALSQRSITEMPK